MGRFARQLPKQVSFSVEPTFVYNGRKYPCCLMDKTRMHLGGGRGYSSE